MQRTCALATALTTLLLGVAGTALDAAASCNIIPSTSAVGSSVPQSSSVAIPGDLPHRGAIGRIDRAYMLAGATDQITIGADPNCASPGMSVLNDNDGNGTIDADDVVISLYFPALLDSANRVIPVRRYASQAICDQLELAAGGTHTDDVVWKSIEPCSNAGVQIQNAPGGFRIHVPYPTVGDDTVGSLTALVRKADPEAAAQLRAADKALLTGDCAANSRHWIEQGATYACIDRIFLDGPSTATCSLLMKASDPWTCQLAQLPAKTEFSKQCTCACLDPSATNCDCGTTQCVSPATQSESKWYVDECKLKGIHGGFDWTDVFVHPGGRIVAGQAGAGRNGQGPSASRVEIPGREFVASTLPGPGDIGDPRVPQVNVWYSPDHPEESGLIGVVDKQASVLHIFPRYPVNRICKSAISPAEGCLAVVEKDHKGAEDCACDQDRQATGCTCGFVDENDHDAARFYACRGGPFEGRPCTRPAHCGIDGICDGKPTCQKANEVWLSSTKPTGTECWDDDECAGVANKPQCGYALFDFVAKRDDPNDPNNPRVVTLEHKITTTGKDRRGICENQPGKKKTCAKGNACPAGDTCVGYSLEARERLP